MKKASLLLSLLLLAGCTNGGTSNGGSGSSKSVAVKDAVDAAYATVLEENKVASMEMDKDTVISYFSLDDAIVKDAYGMGPMMSAHIDMIVAIETAKPSDAAIIESIMETYQENLENDSMQYPMNLAAISEAEVFSEGNYVYYVRLNTYTSDDLSDDQRAEVIEKINDKAEEAIEALHK